MTTVNWVPLEIDSTIILVVLISYAVCASDDCAAETKGPVKCYECSTVNHESYCGDPFNSTAPALKTVECEEACVKWLRKPKFGPTHIIRTCASSLIINMQWSHVCMKESRPGDGRLCFCNDDHCNGGQSWHSAKSTRLWDFLCLSMAAILFTRCYTSGRLLLGDAMDCSVEMVTSLACALWILLRFIMVSVTRWRSVAKRHIADDDHSAICRRNGRTVSDDIINKRLKRNNKYAINNNFTDNSKKKMTVLESAPG